MLFNVFDIITKIWQLGGWFYISLVAAVIIVITSKRTKPAFNYAILIIAALISIYYFGREISNNRPQIINFFAPPQILLNKQTFGQSLFALHLRQTLPPEAKGCIYFSWDIPTYYLISELYPRIFRSVKPDYPPEKCGYIISQFKPKPELSQNLILQFENNYLYQIK